MEDWKKQLENIKKEVKNDNKDEKLKWIDTHSHYDHSKFKTNKKQILETMKEDVSKIISLGTNMKTNQSTLVLCSLYDYIYGMIGFFPSDVWELEKEFCKDANDNWLIFTKQLLNQKIVGIGEIGLDYHWNCIGNSKNPFCVGEKAHEVQKKWFKKQIDLAKELQLPVSMHSRDAEEDTLKIFDDYDNINGVMHCFSYGIDSAKAYLDKGIYLGFGGTSTYPRNKELREVIKMCPIDRILLETDAPYLSPNPVRREINTSSNIKYVIENIATLKGMSFEEVVIKTNENANRLFKFEGRK